MAENLNTEAAGFAGQEHLAQATAIGVVLGSTIFSNEMSRQSAGLIASLSNESGHLFFGGAALTNVFVVHGLQGPSRFNAERAYFLSISKIWILHVVLGVLKLVVSCFVSRKVLENPAAGGRIGLGHRGKETQACKGPKAGDRYGSMSFYYVCFLRHVIHIWKGWEGGLRG